MKMYSRLSAYYHGNMDFPNVWERCWPTRTIPIYTKGLSPLCDSICICPRYKDDPGDHHDHSCSPLTKLKTDTVEAQVVQMDSISALGLTCICMKSISSHTLGLDLEVLMPKWTTQAPE